MQTQLEVKKTDSKLRKIAKYLGLIGWVSGLVQITLAIAAASALVTAIRSPSISEAYTPGIAIAAFWDMCGIVALLGGIYLAFYLTRLAHRFRQPASPSHPHPPKGQVIKALRTGVVIGLVGIGLLLLGEGVTVGALLLKAIAQPKPGAIYDANQLIRTMDILVLIPNVSGTLAHFVGITSSLGLLNWISRQ